MSFYGDNQKVDKHMLASSLVNKFATQFSMQNIFLREPWRNSLEIELQNLQLTRTFSS